MDSYIPNFVASIYQLRSGTDILNLPCSIGIETRNNTSDKGVATAVLGGGFKTDSHQDAEDAYSALAGFLELDSLTLFDTTTNRSLAISSSKLRQNFKRLTNYGISGTLTVDECSPYWLGNPVDQTASAQNGSPLNIDYQGTVPLLPKITVTCNGTDNNFRLASDTLGVEVSIAGNFVNTDTIVMTDTSVTHNGLGILGSVSNLPLPLKLKPRQVTDFYPVTRSHTLQIEFTELYA